jgi:ABC-type nitrate/sulfonate/bicarbonate transport system substrate-binding protein
MAVAPARGAVKRSFIFILCIMLSPAASTAQEKFRAASGGFSTAIHAVLWIAYEKKIFQKFGLDGEYLALESGTPAMQTLLANELQIVFTTGALAITANLQGADTSA